MLTGWWSFCDPSCEQINVFVGEKAKKNHSHKWWSKRCAFDMSERKEMRITTKTMFPSGTMSDMAYSYQTDNMCWLVKTGVIAQNTSYLSYCKREQLRCLFTGNDAECQACNLRDNGTSMQLLDRVSHSTQTDLLMRFRWWWWWWRRRRRSQREGTVMITWPWGTRIMIRSATTRKRSVTVFAQHLVPRMHGREDPDASLICLIVILTF